MDNKQGFAVQIDPVSMIKDVSRQWWVILILSLSASLFAFVWAEKTYQPRYTVTSTFVVTAKGMNSNIYQNLSSAKELAESFSHVLDSNVLKKKVTEDLGMSSFRAETAVSILPETNLMELTVTADSAMEAFLVMRSIMKNYNSVSDYVIENVILEVLQSPKIPTAPINSLNSGQMAKKAFLIAAVFFTFCFAVASYFKDTVKNEKEFSEKVDAKMLGRIYHERKAKSLRDLKHVRSVSLLITSPLLSFRFVESNKMMGSRVRSHMDKKGAKVVLVTSVTENEGKSTVAANLAVSLAQENKKVLLMDFDFRKPVQYKILEIPPDEIANLPEVLMKKGELKNIIRKHEESNLYTVLNNTATGSISQLMESGAIRKALEFFRNKMDYIVLDTSPMALVADTEEIAKLADVSLLVVRQDVALAKEINDIIDVLNEAGGSVMGCIFNDVTGGPVGGGSHYGYGGYYGRYYGKRAE